jgi:hypothetical protein
MGLLLRLGTLCTPVELIIGACPGRRGERLKRVAYLAKRCMPAANSATEAISKKIRKRFDES